MALGDGAGKYRDSNGIRAGTENTNTRGESECATNISERFKEQEKYVLGRKWKQVFLGRQRRKHIY